MHNTQFEDFQAFRRELSDVITDMKALVDEFPNSRAFDVILAQLQQVEIWTASGRPLLDEEWSQLYFGRLANTDVEAIDSKLARRLNCLSGHLREWK